MKKVLITGASRGIGFAIAKNLREQGHQVVAPLRDELDLADPDSIGSFLNRLWPLDFDVLINNAGINEISSISEMPLELWNKTFHVNVTAPFILTKAVIGSMAEKKWGRILNISSCYSLISREKRAAYSASKAALNALTRTAAIEFGEHNVLVNAICPGFIETDLTYKNNTVSDINSLCESIPVRRLGSVSEIADFASYLCSEANTYITGQAIPIDGGYLCQ